MFTTRRKIFYWAAMAAMIVAANQLPFIQAVTARITAGLYVTLTYSDMEFTFEKVEFVPQFGDYFVTYRSNNGKHYSITVTPNFLPVLIQYDPLDPEA